MRWLIVGMLLYLVLAYLIMPELWRMFERVPAPAGTPKTTTTPDHIPADPLNIGFVGTDAELIHAFLKAGWLPADPITWRTSVGIVESVLLHRADPTAPVSTLMLFGRRQDLAFERPVGSSARQRHHLRLWQTAESGQDGRPLWLGAATFDRSVGLSHRTGQVTHHIAPDIDAERDSVIEGLHQSNQLASTHQMDGVGVTLRGRNGGGDWYFTDGEISIGVLPIDNTPHPPTAQPLHPPAVVIKKHLWRQLRAVLAHLSENDY